MSTIHYKMSPVPEGTKPRAVCGPIYDSFTLDKSKVTCNQCLEWAIKWWGSVENWLGGNRVKKESGTESG